MIPINYPRPQSDHYMDWKLPVILNKKSQEVRYGGCWPNHLWSACKTYPQETSAYKVLYAVRIKMKEPK